MITEHNTPESEALKQGKLLGLRYAMIITNHRRVIKKTPDFMAALSEVDIFLEAAIERVENGEDMHDTCDVT